MQFRRVGVRPTRNWILFRGERPFPPGSPESRSIQRLCCAEGRSIRVEASLNDILDKQPEPIFDGTVDAPPNPEGIYATRELNALVEDQIRELPPRVQTAFRLRKIEEFSITEAVQALGIRETALKSRVSRARRKIARGLRKLLSTASCPHATLRGYPAAGVRPMPGTSI